MGVYYGPTAKVVDNGLVLYLDAANTVSYPGSGTTWTDLSGNGNNGTLLGGASYVDRDLGVIKLDPNQYISVGNGLPTGNTWSANIWFLIDGPTSFASNLHRTFISSNNFRFQWDDINSLTARGPFIDFVSAIGAGQASYSNSLTVSDVFNQWHMASVTSDGSTVKVYYDSLTAGTVVSGSRNYSTNGISEIGRDNLSLIGAIDYLNGDGGNVYISQVSIYNRALTAAEISQNFNALRGRFGI